jgi:hypothetical protein
MIFSDFIRSTLGNDILFKNETPIENVGKVIFYKDNASGNFVKKEFRWSFNKNHWSSWMTLNQENISNISAGNNKNLYLEIQYSNSGNGSCSSFSINYDLNKGTTFSNSDSCDFKKPAKTEIIKITDADTLDEKNGAYYLNREHHTGQQSISTIKDLQKTLTNLSGLIQDVEIENAFNVDSSGIGVYYGKTDKNLYFKTLNQGNKIFLAQDAGGHILISVDDASITQIFNYVNSLNGYNLGSAGPTTNGEIFKIRQDNIFQFRSLVPGNSNIRIQTLSDQIVISLDTSVAVDSIWIDRIPVSTTVGGITGTGDGGYYAPVGKNAISILEDLLYEYFPPNIILNTDPSSKYYEKWIDILEVSIYGSFDNQPFEKVRVTDISIYDNIFGGFGTISYPEVSNGTFNFHSVSNINWEDIIYTIRVYNKIDGGNTMPVLESSIAIFYVNPYVWGIVDDSINITNIDASIIIGFINSGNKLIVPKEDNDIIFVRDPSMGIQIKCFYAYEASYGPLQSIIDVGNNFNVISSFDSKILPISLGSSPGPIPYIVYIKNHWIDSSTFELLFKI